MNERIKELAEQAIANVRFWKGCNQESYGVDEHELAKFAELIIRECIGLAHSVGDLRGVNDDMIYGADTAAVQISKHFGVE